MAANVPAHIKFWVYALQGILYEICFTAMWNVSIQPNTRLMGESSIWSIWVYGMGGLLNEYAIYNKIKHQNILLRILCNLVYTYTWEYSCGTVLRVFGACPWDYTERRWNVHGLITFQYAPAWVLVGILNERLAALLQSVCWCEKKKEHGNGNVQNHAKIQ